MASRNTPNSKIPKWTTPPASPRVQAYASNDSKKSVSATSSPRHISFRSKPTPASLTLGSKIPKRPSAITQNEQSQNCSYVTPAKKPITNEQEARVDVVQFGACQVRGGEGDTQATTLDPNKAKDPPFINTDQNEEEDLDNALVGLIKPFSDRDFSKFLHISPICEEETLETIKPPAVSADYATSTYSMDNVRIPVESSSSTFERKSTPMDLWLGTENSEVIVPQMEKLRGHAEGLVNELLNEAAMKAVSTKYGDSSDQMKIQFSCKDKEEGQTTEPKGEEDYSLQFEDLVTKLGAPTKSETQIMKQMDFNDEQLPEPNSSVAEIQQVRSSDSRLRKYKVFLESSTDIGAKKSTPKPVVVPTLKTSAKHIPKTKPSKVEVQLGTQPQQTLSRHDQLDDHQAQNSQKVCVQTGHGYSPVAMEEQIVREADVSLPTTMVQEEVREYAEESQSDAEALGYGITESDYGNESEDGGDTGDDGEDMIINLDLLNSNDAVIGKKARTIFSVDLSMSKIQVKHGAGENGDGNHNQEWNVARPSSRKSKTSFEAPSLPSLTKHEDTKDDSRTTVITRGEASKAGSYNSIHSLYSRKYNSGQKILKMSADKVDKPFEQEDEESTSSDEREIPWNHEMKSKPFDVNMNWVGSTMDQKRKIWLEQGENRYSGIICQNNASRLEDMELQLASVNGRIKDIYERIVYYRTVVSAAVVACALFVAIPIFLPGLEELVKKEKEPTWWESLFGFAGKK